MSGLIDLKFFSWLFLFIASLRRFDLVSVAKRASSLSCMVGSGEVTLAMCLVRR